ncbi:hypothetical protein SAMN05443637_103220 [Pseudonocardia thermophila]|uniref:Acyl-CoA dehydrogenase, N-terminal domain n=1 Tax=Pseudonocardia thermophila TaxID=1848 RepID=A0A1M6QC02_PSETH|nr:hypothetical protein [Pseudonocardia thermophila]SHK17607.1 hypothetical protein SAMN05443637_103220 [Pseudonocardia thermophila]
MAVDFDLTPAQRAVKRRAREFAHDVLRPAAEAADALPDPQQAFCAMKPVYRQAQPDRRHPAPRRTRPHAR